jgi:putative flavoprotein involved in K+ transport
VSHRRNTVIVGAGHAGLAASRILQRKGVDHVVLEKGRIGESWATQRWDSFHLNTPNWANALPDLDYAGDQPGGFLHRDQVVELLRDYRQRFTLPVREDCEVLEVSLDPGGDFVASCADGTGWQAENLVICSGIQNAPITPAVAAELPARIHQLHAADYRNAVALPAGAVLVVGGAQSGVQIAEDLIEAGRGTYLCTSKVGRAVRRYRGRDLLEWSRDAGLTAHTPADLPDPEMQFWPQPQISGAHGGRTVSLHSLGRQGVVLLGRLTSVHGEELQIADDLLANAAWSDGISAKFKEMIDGYIEAAGLEVEPPQPDEAEAPFLGLAEQAQVRQLRLDEADISTVIWATGFGGDFSYLNFPVHRDERGTPAHDRGVAPTPGLYYLGFPWLRTRASGIIAGIVPDAEWVCECIAAVADRP